MEFNDIASVSGKSGLFKVISPTRNGVILESLEDGKKLIAGMRMKVSVLGDISIYTTDGEGSVPLEEVMKKIHKEFDGDTDLNASSEPGELKSFLRHILPAYDEDKVYVSDMKKLVTWYNKLATDHPELLQDKVETIEGKDAADEKAGQS